MAEPQEPAAAVEDWLVRRCTPAFLRAAGARPEADAIEQAGTAAELETALDRARVEAHYRLEAAWSTRTADLEATRAAAWAARTAGLDAAEDSLNGQLGAAARAAIDAARSALLAAALTVPRGVAQATLRPIVRELQDAAPGAGTKGA